MTVTNSIRVIGVVSLVCLLSGLFCTSVTCGATTYTTAAETDGLFLNGPSEQGHRRTVAQVDTTGEEYAATYECLLAAEGAQYGFDHLITACSDDLTTSDIVDLVGAMLQPELPQVAPGGNHVTPEKMSRFHLGNTDRNDVTPTAAAPAGTPGLEITRSDAKAAMPAPGGLLLLGLSTGSVGWIRRRHIA
jgi:hypothetical protein